jgi:hypothetical protein
MVILFKTFAVYLNCYIWTFRILYCYKQWSKAAPGWAGGLKPLLPLGHVWMEVLVLVCSKLTPKLTLWSQTPVLVWC